MLCEDEVWPPGAAAFSSRAALMAALLGAPGTTSFSGTVVCRGCLLRYTVSSSTPDCMAVDTRSGAHTGCVKWCK